LKAFFYWDDFPADQSEELSTESPMEIAKYIKILSLKFYNLDSSSNKVIF